IDVLFAPGYDDAALEALKAKPNTRLLLDRERRRFDPGEKDYKRVVGGLLVQDRDWDIEERELMEVRCGKVDEAQWGDLLFAWRGGRRGGGRGQGGGGRRRVPALGAGVGRRWRASSRARAGRLPRRGARVPDAARPGRGRADRPPRPAVARGRGAAPREARVP